MRTAFLLSGWLLARAALAAVPEIPSSAREAVERAITIPNARAVLQDYRPTLAGTCTVSHVETPPVDHSARVALKLYGTWGNTPCSGWAWVRVQLFAPTLVVIRSVREGESLRAAVSLSERELTTVGRFVSELPEGAVAGQALPTGTLLQPSQIRSGGPKLGSAVTVVLQTGTLELRQPGRLAPCAPDRACAVLASGKRIEGHLDGNLLRVEIP